MTTQAYFLVAHGSRSPHSTQSLEVLAHHFREIIADRSPQFVKTGSLEFQACSLADQLVQFYQSLPFSCSQVHVLPVFLLPGNHVREDIPAEIDRAQAQLDLNVQDASPFILSPHLGSHPALKQILLDKIAAAKSAAWILLGHGSRRPAGNRAIEQLANHLDAHPAFWAVQPTLTDQVHRLVHQGVQSIGVVPYFLFSGKITAAIAEQVEALTQQYPHLALQLLSPLEPSPELAAALYELAHLPAMSVTSNIRFSPNSLIL